MEITRTQLLQLSNKSLQRLLSLVDVDTEDEVMLVLNGLQEIVDIDITVMEQVMQIQIE